MQNSDPETSKRVGGFYGRIFVYYYELKTFIKRLLGMKFKFKCLECNKGHDGRTLFIENMGYTRISDFCSGDCTSKYIFKHGYTFRPVISDKLDFCIVCGKQHNTQLFKLDRVTRSFCSKKCMAEAKKKVLPKVKEKYKKEFLEFLSTFKGAKTIKEMSKKTEIKKDTRTHFVFRDFNMEEILK